MLKILKSLRKRLKKNNIVKIDTINNEVNNNKKSSSLTTISKV